MDTSKITASFSEEREVPIYVGGMIGPPKRSDWQAHCADITWHPRHGTEPNRFHRFMQELAFGIKWRRAPEDK